MAMIDDIIAGTTGPDGRRTVAVSVDMVRKRLRDFPKYNELVRQELSDEEYVDCILRGMNDFNMLPPFQSQYSAYDFPDHYMLLDAAVYEALQVLVIWHARNQFSASDAGLQVPIHEQWQPLMQIATLLRTRLDDRMAKLKAQINIANGFGSGVYSPLWMR